MSFFHNVFGINLIGLDDQYIRAQQSVQNLVVKPTFILVLNSPNWSQNLSKIRVKTGPKTEVIMGLKGEGEKSEIGDKTGNKTGDLMGEKTGDKWKTKRETKLETKLETNPKL